MDVFVSLLRAYVRLDPKRPIQSSGRLGKNAGGE